MSIETFYQAIGGDLADVRGRLQTDDRVEKFARMFLMDDSYAQLLAAHEAGDFEAEFRAAHTLKGNCRNMGFIPLFTLADELTEALRPGADGAPADLSREPELLAQLSSAYERLVAASQEHL